MGQPAKSVFVPVGAGRRRRVPWLVLILLAVAVGYSAFLLWPRAPRDPRDQAFAAACPLVAEHLRAPMTAVFPKRGQAEENPLGGWILTSHVDAKNALGVPIRMHWSAWMNREAGVWKCGYIDLDGERVFESSFVTAFKAEARKLVEAEAVKRRARGTWETVISFEGENQQRSKTFRTTLPNWRITGKITGAAAISVYTKDGNLVATFPDNSKEFFRPLNEPAGEYYLQLRRRSGLARWVITIEE